MALVTLAALAGCGAEPSPDPQAEAGAVSAAGSKQAEPANAPGGEQAEPTSATDHPRPEWAEVEIDPLMIASEIEPEDYVRDIRAALAHHGTKEDPVPLSVDFLGGWLFDETKDNPFPPHVRAVHGAYVTMKGFMLPDVDFEGITAFHLVRSLWGCCFGAPPRVNELVKVYTPDQIGIEYTYNTLEIVGRLDVVFEIEDGLIEDLYRVHCDSILEGEFDDPLAPEGIDPAELADQAREMEF